MNRIFKTLFVAFVGFLIWIIYQRDVGAQLGFIGFIAAIPYGDKWGHFFLFGTLTFITILATQFHRFSAPRLNAVYSAPLLIAIVVALEETSQLFLDTRTFEWLDLVADALGILVFAFAARLVELRSLDAQADEQSALPKSTP